MDKYAHKRKPATNDEKAKAVRFIQHLMKKHGYKPTPYEELFNKTDEDLDLIAKGLSVLEKK